MTSVEQAISKLPDTDAIYGMQQTMADYLQIHDVDVEKDPPDNGNFHLVVRGWLMAHNNPKVMETWYENHATAMYLTIYRNDSLRRTWESFWTDNPELLDIFSTYFDFMRPYDQLRSTIADAIFKEHADPDILDTQTQPFEADKRRLRDLQNHLLGFIVRELGNKGVEYDDLFTKG